MKMVMFDWQFPNYKEITTTTAITKRGTCVDIDIVVISFCPNGTIVWRSIWSWPNENVLVQFVTTDCGYVLFAVKSRVRILMWVLQRKHHVVNRSMHVTSYLSHEEWVVAFEMSYILYWHAVAQRLLVGSVLSIKKEYEFYKYFFR